MRVAILPTGEMEWHALHLALERLFPNHHFYQVPTHAEVESNPEGFPYRGFTSRALTSQHLDDPPEDASELVARAAQEALGDRTREAADLVVVIDDLELQNAHQAPLVANVFRATVQGHLDSIAGAGRLVSTRAALRERVSFHLAAPMIEAWLFADPTAPARAGVPSGTNVAFADTQDPEDFETGDLAYLAATEAACPCWVARGRVTRRGPRWLGSLPRERHPKGYLQWLCLEGTAPSCTSYGEGRGGAEALRGLRWGHVFARPSPQLQYLAALVDDVAAALGQPPATGPLGRALSPVTALSSVRTHRLLRNL